MKNFIAIISIVFFSQIATAGEMTITINGMKQPSCNLRETAICDGAGCKCYPRGSSVTVIDGVTTVTPPSPLPPPPGPQANSQRNFDQELNQEIGSCIDDELEDFFVDTPCVFDDNLKNAVANAKETCTSQALQKVGRGIRGETDRFLRAQRGIPGMLSRAIENTTTEELNRYCAREGETRYTESGEVVIIEPSVDPILEEVFR